MSNMCKAEAETFFESVRGRLDTVCIGAVRLLESLCCLDVNRFAKPEKPLTGSLPVLFVVMLVVILYNAFVFGYMPAAGIAINSRTSLLFHAWIFLTLSSFAQAVRTDPGSAPTDARWCDKDVPPSEAKERKRCSDEARWCRKSNAYKPDRAHYCRVLKKGVLRMDHYCPWLGNTVGFFNQKFFFLFLLYTNAACAHLGISFIQLLVQYTLPALTTFCLVGAEGLTLLISSLLVPFFLFHVWLIARNTTTIEFCERMRSGAEENAEGKDNSDAEGLLAGLLRYDLGIFQNFSAVLGSNPLLWLIPVGGPSGDGVNFPMNPAFEQAFAQTAAMHSSKCAEEASPEAAHPVASSEEYSDEQVKTRQQKSRGAQNSTEDGCKDRQGDLETGNSMDSGDSREASESEFSHAASSSTGGDDGFLVWRDSAEFVEDLTIGCQFIGEKTEDCTRVSFLHLIASCVPGPWGRKAARKLAGARLASWKPTRLEDESHGFPKSSRRGGPAGKAAVWIATAGSEDEGGSVSSASGAYSDGRDFLSD